MLSALKKLFRQEGHEHILTPQHEKARFELRYGDLAMGHLWLDEGVWHFAYTPEFRRQEAVKPLVDFPDTAKQYTSQALWPFFQFRIPSLEQPAVQRAIEEKALDEHDEVQLLRAFGKTTISNPFVLDPLG